MLTTSKLSHPSLANLEQPRSIQTRPGYTDNIGVGISSLFRGGCSVTEDALGGWDNNFNVGLFNLSNVEYQDEVPTYLKGTFEEYSAIQLPQPSSHCSIPSSRYSSKLDSPHCHQRGHSESQWERSNYPQLSNKTLYIDQFAEDNANIQSSSASASTQLCSRPLAPAPFAKQERNQCTGPISESGRLSPFTGTYTCGNCTKSFRRASDLKYALNVECFETSLTPSRKHSKTHDDQNDRPHTCEDCSMKFYYLKDLIRHQISKHKIKYSSNGHSCQFCGRTFIRLDKLRRHQRTMHSVDTLGSDSQFKLNH